MELSSSDKMKLTVMEKFLRLSALRRRKKAFSRLKT